MKETGTKNIQNWTLGGILLLLFLLVCRLFSPFFSVLLWTTLLYIIFRPLHRNLIKKINLKTRKGKILKTFYAAVFSLGTVIIIVAPLFLVGMQLFKQLWELLSDAKEILNKKPDTIKNTLQIITTFISELTNGHISITPEEIITYLTSLLSSTLQQFFHFGTSVIRNIGSFIANLAFMIISLFFFYLDGKALLTIAKRVIPIRSEYMDKLLGKFNEITKSLFLGYIMVGIIQAAVGYIIFLIFQVKNALVFSILIIFLSFIPLVGPIFIWLPVGIIKVLNGNVVEGIVFMAICTATVSSLDNILRPLFLKDSVRLHPLIIFFAIIGGITLFGFNGLILGPMVVILFLTVLDFFLEEHKAGNKT